MSLAPSIISRRRRRKPPFFTNSEEVAQMKKLYFERVARQEVAYCVSALSRGGLIKMEDYR